MCIFGGGKKNKTPVTPAGPSAADIAAQQTQATADAAKAQQDLVTSLTNGFNDQIKAAQDAGQQQVDALTAQNAALTATITGQQGQFASTQTELLSQFQAAAGAQAGAMAALLKSQEESAQKPKKPNYAQALAKNKALNGNGLSSTMLTGSGGVTASALPLGTTSLLGS